MIERQSWSAGIVIVVLAAAGGAGMWMLLNSKAGETAKSTSSVPATVPKPLKEDQITAFTLKPEAEEALKLQFGVVDFKPMPRSRLYGGEVTIPPGRTIIVSAPFSGILQTVGGELPSAGMDVVKGKPVFELLPLLTPEGRATLAASLVEAQGQVNNAETSKSAALVARDRARMLLMDDAGSKKQFDDAQAAFDLASSMFKAAQDRKKKLEELSGDAEKGTAAPLPIYAPANGILRNVSAAHGQNVPGGAILFEVLDLSTVWVRVPINVADEDELQPDATALIGRLNARPERIGANGPITDKLIEARRIKGLPQANAIAGSVDVWFQLANTVTNYRPGQRVGVTIAFRSERESLTVPWSAVLHDIHGGTWVYEPLGDHKFVRHQVIVRYVRDGAAALALGPPKGTKVVTVGAIELFGTETGFSK